jgi:hypothetical protein
MKKYISNKMFFRKRHHKQSYQGCPLSFTGSTEDLNNSLNDLNRISEKAYIEFYKQLPKLVKFLVKHKILKIRSVIKDMTTMIIELYLSLFTNKKAIYDKLLKKCILYDKPKKELKKYNGEPINIKFIISTEKQKEIEELSMLVKLGGTPFFQDMYFKKLNNEIE